MNFNYAIKNYLERVLNMQNINLTDGPKMCVALDPKLNKLRRINNKYQITLPMSDSSRKAMLGNFGDTMSDDLAWTILVAGLYHELGHIISCEPVYTSPLKGLIANYISDANENNVIPNAWFGSMKYLNTLNRLFRPQDISDTVANGSVKSQFDLIMHIANRYRIDLFIPYGGENIESLPEKHELHDVVEEIKPIMERARREWSENPVQMKRIRDKLIKELQTAVEDWYKSKSESEKDGKSLEQHATDGKNNKSTSEDMGEQIKQMSREDAKELAEALSQSVGNDIKDDMDRAIAAGKYDEVEDNRAKEAAAEGAVKNEDKASCIENLDFLSELDSYGTGHSDTGHVERPVTGLRAFPDNAVVHELRATFRRMTFGRTYKGRKVDIVGSKLHPPNFYQIKTTDKPALRKDIGKVRITEARTDIVMMFDSSGSMGPGCGSDNHNFSRSVMATFYAALKPIKDMRMEMFGFDTEVTYIRDNGQVYHNIEDSLHSSGGTAFMLALRVGLRSLEKSSAKRKILIMLTDGDLQDSTGYTLDALQRHAKRHKIRVIVIDVNSGSALMKKDYFDSVVFIKSCRELLKQMKKISRKRF